jgi:hypothetical protein
MDYDQLELTVKAKRDGILEPNFTLPHENELQAAEPL